MPYPEHSYAYRYMLEHKGLRKFIFISCAKENSISLKELEFFLRKHFKIATMSGVIYKTRKHFLFLKKKKKLEYENGKQMHLLIFKLKTNAEVPI